MNIPYTNQVLIIHSATVKIINTDWLVFKRHVLVVGD